MNAIDRLIELDRKTKKKILVIGDRMQDVYVHGRLDVGQEECLKFVEESRTLADGGSANAAAQLKNWNASVALLSGPEHQQIVKTRFLVNGKHVFRHDDDESDQDQLLQAREESRDWLQRYPAIIDAILISDYDKGFLTPEFIREVIDLANRRGIPCVADAKREPKLYAGAILKCNDNWYDKFIEDESLGYPVVKTFGEQSPTVMKEENEGCTPVKKKVICVNHVGAGDCFAAHLTLALAHGLTLEDAAAIAHSAGRVYVQHPHNRPPWPHEIRKDIDPVGGKVISQGSLSALRQSNAGRIVFTNGVFDLLGPHHVYMLQEAKNLGDVLVVGVNSDSSVHLLKGPSRPVMKLSERMDMLCSLSCVDWVVPFDEDTPVELLKAILPEVRVAGDFPERNPTGDEFAKEIKLIYPMHGLSTTQVMNRINRVIE